MNKYQVSMWFSRNNSQSDPTSDSSLKIAPNPICLPQLAFLSNKEYNNNKRS
ncbi:hypothetical protein DPMN_024327 [Dreissena polymorpha]|uniref:Uncharacterized protein n=1 Tax=Dreissena polymorpha TaxID=45954 RepID=A0A9D4LPC8_DREPO|nr:hypothetical protein DPMN_024327 [Dreissena polymorpha]